MNIVLGQIVRKILAALLGGAITWLINSGVLTQGTAEQWLELTAAMIAFALIACWTNWILPWFKKLLDKNTA